MTAAATGPRVTMVDAERWPEARARAGQVIRGARGTTVIVRVRDCSGANRDHARALRQYAHTGHVPSVVCVAHAFWQLPRGHQRGLLLHELGHLALRHRRRHTEADADREALRRYGVRVRYRSSRRWGQRLEYA